MDRQYIISERAHLMCPNMHFAILFTLDSDYNEIRVHDAIKQISYAHPFLKCLIAQDLNGKYYYEYYEELQIDVGNLFSKENLESDYREITKQGWNVFQKPLLKVYAYKEEKQCTMLFVAHHLLCDGRGLLGIISSFADCYVKGITPSYTEEHLMQSIDDLPNGSELPWISKCVIRSANKNWEKEQHKISYEEYLSFEKEYVNANKYNMINEIKSVNETTKINELCKTNSISVNDYLVAEMMIKENTTKVVVAADIRKYYSKYSQGSLGNYSTAFSVKCKAKTSGTVELAKAVSMQIHKIMNSPKKLFLVLACYFRMNPELLDAVAISSLSTFESKAGRFVGENMFGYKKRNGCSITNLGKIDNVHIKVGLFIPPASPANRVTQGVLTVNGVMQICTLRS